MKKIIFILMGLCMLSIVCAGQSGINYYSTSNRYENISEPNQTYKFKFIMDDIGTMANTPAIADIDNDGVNELLTAGYYGRMQVWNWTGMKKGLRESRDSDRGTYYLSCAMGNHIIGGDNNGNGCLEMAVNDYNGYLRVVEYCNNTWTSIFNDSYRAGYYRTSPEWIDIDLDGDLDIFSCTYNGICRLFIYDSVSSTYSLNFTDSDRGSYNYGCNPVCGNISNSNYQGCIINTYDGRTYYYNWTGSALEMVWNSEDIGSFYSEPGLDDFLGDGINYIIVGTTNGIFYAYNCSEGNSPICVNTANSSDIGNWYYGGGQFIKKNIGGKVIMFGSGTSPRPVMIEYVDATTLTATLEATTMYGEYYVPLGMPNTNQSSDGIDYILLGNRYHADIGVYKRTTGYDWKLDVYNPHMIANFYTRQYYYGFLYMSGFACGDLDNSTPEDECVIIDYNGLPLVYTLQNITEYPIEFHDDYELALLDIMPKTSIQYLPKGKNRTYCVNEDENVLLYSLGGGQIDTWANAIDDEGTAISSPTRITDGVLSTASLFDNQNSVDYTQYDSGTDQSFRINLSKTIHIGEIKFWDRFRDERNTYDLRIDISNESCTQPDTNSYTTIFDEDEDNSNEDISGTSNYQGTMIRFVPQDVRCIKISASGSYYDTSTYSSANYVTEVKAYYANDCTFYHVPMDIRGAEPSNDYNSSIALKLMKDSDSPNQIDNNLIDRFSEFVSDMLSTINRWIIER